MFHGDRLFIDLFIGFFVAALISFLIYLLDPSLLASRLSLSMSGIFASIGNKYVIDNKVISSTSFSLYDTIQLATFASISLVLVITIICLKSAIDSYVIGIKVKCPAG